MDRWTFDDADALRHWREAGLPIVAQGWETERGKQRYVAYTRARTVTFGH